MGRRRGIGALLTMLALVGCGAPLQVAELGRIHVEILHQGEVQSRCARLGIGLSPPIGYLVSTTLGCAHWQEGHATVYSVDSAEVLLHELDHAVNQKGCHTFFGTPDYCHNETRSSEPIRPVGDVSFP